MQATAPPGPDAWESAFDQRGSPVSIDHQFGKPTPAQKRAVLPLATLSLNYLYQELLKHKLWNARFDRGGRCVKGPAVRSLATRHLGSPATDGWNVVIGALELAREWALRTTSTVMPEGHDPHRLDRNTRLRLAACLSVTWKFQRSCNSHFPHRFKDVGEFYGYPNLYDGHTRELAHVAYGFFFASEQTAFGGFHEDNLDQVRALYQTMILLEADLVGKVPIFSLLTDNVQVTTASRPPLPWPSHTGRRHQPHLATAPRPASTRRPYQRTASLPAHVARTSPGHPCPHASPEVALHSAARPGHAPPCLSMTPPALERPTRPPFHNIWRVPFET